MHRTNTSRDSSALEYVGAAVVAVGLGLLLATQGLPDPVVAGELMLALAALAVLVAQRRRSLGLLAKAGPGVRIAAFGLAVAFLIGVLASNDLGAHKSAIAFSYGVSVFTLLAGAAVTVAFAGGFDGLPLRRGTVDVLRLPFVVIITIALFSVALVNFSTGAVPLLSGNIDAARFGGDPGALGQLWVWVIGGLEWLLVCVGVRAVWMSRLDARGAVVVVLGSVALALFAGRSFFVVVGLAIVVAMAAFGRLPASRLIALLIVGVIALGIAGNARISKSDQANAQTLSSPTTTGRVVNLVSQSATVGPAVYTTVLDKVPEQERFQHGNFLLRDFLAAVPFHPFGRPDRGDIWVTDVIRQRDPLVVGGSPPTLAGGLYIDFGLPGILIGGTLLGIVLALLGRWVSRRPTVGSIALYAYASAYVALASYSYLSVKPAVLAVVVLSLVLHRVELLRGERAQQGHLPLPSTRRTVLPVGLSHSSLPE